MFRTETKIFVATQPVDFRAGFDRLQGYVRERNLGEPRSGALFVFFNRRADKLKILFFDKTGDCILYKRLDHGTFNGIITFEPEEQSVAIDAQALRTLLLGTKKKAQRTIH